MDVITQSQQTNGLTMCSANKTPIKRNNLKMSNKESKNKEQQLPLAHVINWVAVSERLPELNIETEYGKTTKGILCLHSAGHMESCNLNEGIDEGDEPYWSYEQDGDLCETVTHWADH